MTFRWKSQWKAQLRTYLDDGGIAEDFLRSRWTHLEAFHFARVLPSELPLYLNQGLRKPRPLAYARGYFPQVEERLMIEAVKCSHGDIRSRNISFVIDDRAWRRASCNFLSEGSEFLTHIVSHLRGRLGWDAVLCPFEEGTPTCFTVHLPLSSIESELLWLGKNINEEARKPGDIASESESCFYSYNDVPASMLVAYEAIELVVKNEGARPKGAVLDD